MYRKIVVGHDLRQGGNDALALGSLLAEATDAQLVIAGVFPVGELPRGFEAQWREHEAEIASEIQATAAAAGAQAEAFPSSSPARGLHALAEEIAADLVVVGSSRHAKLGQVLAGNVGVGLLQGSLASVAIAPREYAEHASKKLGPIVVGIDGSKESGLALRVAVELAAASAAKLKLIAVAEPPHDVYGAAFPSQAFKEQAEDRMRDKLAEALESIPQGVPTEPSLLSGDVADKLAEAAAGEALLIIGSRGYGPLRRVMLGSVSTALVRNAPCAVLVPPRGGTT
jgi:nucleotide-binding universal stress UspA family protein